jgi:hypothetical protein
MAATGAQSLVEKGSMLAQTHGTTPINKDEFLETMPKTFKEALTTQRRWSCPEL